MSAAHDDRWAWAEDIWQKEMEPLRQAGYELQRVTLAEYWEIHESELRSHFPPEAFFNLAELRSDAERAGQERLSQVRGDRPLQDFAVIRREGAIAGMFCGHMLEARSYRMWHSNIHRGFRRRGIYSLILQAVIAYTRVLGFDTIVSEHAPGNNAVLIAKLRAGFRIVGLEIEPVGGPSLRLGYFHNPDHLAAYEFRCGLATLNPRLLAHGFGAMAQLIEQCRNAPP